MKDFCSWRFSEEDKEDDGQWSDWQPTIERAKPAEIKAKWSPEAPLGSELEISPVVQDDVEDIFKDIAPKVQTVELMQQLETMFSVLQDDRIGNEENEIGDAWDDFEINSSFSLIRRRARTPRLTNQLTSALGKDQFRRQILDRRLCRFRLRCVVSWIQI